MTEQQKGPTSTLVPRARFLFVTQFWQELSRVGSGARTLWSLSNELVILPIQTYCFFAVLFAVAVVVA